ncbi:MAG: asparaginase, partial [Acidimicrobiia bacterium]|nr:asparaginase [Acidimicrobiia bacterium]
MGRVWRRPTSCSALSDRIDARTQRSGVVEAIHPASVTAVLGDITHSWGEQDRPFFMRSAAKPLQALVSQEAGASLSPRELAVACASHNGEPAHVAMVGSMLAASDLDESALLCPPAWPSYLPEQRRLAAAGVTEPSAVYHNCSGKHAAMLRACVANGWPLSYTDPEHPLQVRVRDLIGEVVGPGTTPTGVDGCGVPTFRVTVGGLAGAYVAVAN